MKCGNKEGETEIDSQLLQNAGNGKKKGKNQGPSGTLQGKSKIDPPRTSKKKSTRKGMGFTGRDSKKRKEKKLGCGGRNKKPRGEENKKKFGKFKNEEILDQTTQNLGMGRKGKGKGKMGKRTRLEGGEPSQTVRLIIQI